MEICLASNNHKKLKEIQAILPATIKVRLLEEFTNEEAEETGLSFIENAILKARFASAKSNLPSLADDSGLMVDALNGAPGIYSARYSKDKTDKANNQKLLEQMQNITNRKAKFLCVLAFVEHEEDYLPKIFEGVWQGQIAKELQGKNGFGYDPLFIINDKGTTSADLEPEMKNQISHRAKALQLFADFLKGRD